MLGLGESGNFPAAIKATTEWFPSEERAFATGLFNSGTNVSFFVAPVLVAFVTGRWGWRAAFLTTGSMGLIWLVVWLLFPYNRLRRGSTQTQANLDADFATHGSSGATIPYSILLSRPGLYAFSLAKGLTDPIWWFYLFYLPKFLHETYGLDLQHSKWEIVTVYMVSSVGSVFGGGLSGWLMNRGYSVNSGRKFALLLCALLVVPIVFVPHMASLFPPTPGPPRSLSPSPPPPTRAGPPTSSPHPPTCSPPPPSPPSSASAGPSAPSAEPPSPGSSGTYFSLHPLLIFALAASAYLIALAIFQLLVPRLGAARPDLITNH